MYEIARAFVAHALIGQSGDGMPDWDWDLGNNEVSSGQLTQSCRGQLACHPFCFLTSGRTLVSRSAGTNGPSHFHVIACLEMSGTRLELS